MFRNKKNGRSADKDIQEQAKRMRQFMQTDLGDAIADAAQDLVDSSFEREQYQGKPSSKWKPRKEDPEADKERQERRGLLIESSRMKNSTVARHKGKAEVSISSDRPVGNWSLAKIHNEGLRPQAKRQFMPIPGEESPVLTRAIEKEIDKFFDKLFS